MFRYPGDKTAQSSRKQQMTVRIGSMCVLVAATLTLASTAPAAVWLDFETFPDGTPIPSGTLLRDQFLPLGIRIEGTDGWAGQVLQEGQYGIQNYGNSPINVVSVGWFGQTTRISFVDPATFA